MLVATSAAVPSNVALHNRSLEPTRTSMPLQALISFWALRVLPARSAQLKR
jgi:hypothetical protein